MPGHIARSVAVSVPGRIAQAAQPAAVSVSDHPFALRREAQP